ncbi:MAG: nucleotidyl transferase AbiEii/AbiGii toxin family protein [Hyphomicrobiales bacterium]
MPLETRDGTLLVASLEDVMATKLKATLDRAEARDYRDIAEMLSAGVSLSRGLAAFKKTSKGGEPAEVSPRHQTLSEAGCATLRRARDQVKDIPELKWTPGSLAVPIGKRDAADDNLRAHVSGPSVRTRPVGIVQLHPVVAPHVSHFRHVPLRTSVKLAHSGQASPT